VDLPGAAGVESGLSLAEIGFRLVPMYANSTSVIGALAAGAGVLQKYEISGDAPPAFLFDSDRNNRVGDFDMPDATYILNAGITRVAVWAQGDISYDLSPIIAHYRGAGIEIINFCDDEIINRETRQDIPVRGAPMHDFPMPDIHIREKEKRSPFGRIIGIVILIAITAFIFSSRIEGFFVRRNFSESATSLLNLDEPIQIATSGEINMRVGDTNVRIEKVAEYSITGRVVGTSRYSFGIRGELSPYDVGLAWGPLSDIAVDDRISWRSSQRWLTFRTNDFALLPLISINSSNTHLIPANNDIRRLLRHIRRNDVVRLEGYLVQAHYTDRGHSITIPTSTSRYDTGNGACEQMYVTSVTWLRQN
jgi:hypothetical protein